MTALSGRRICRFHMAILAGIAVAVIGGCEKSGPQPPQTYPVKGKVVYKKGAPLNGGMIEFRATSDPTLSMMTSIQPDGSFELFTIFENQKLPGAIAGSCQVTVHNLTQMPPPPPFRLSKPITVEPKDNFFTIEIDVPPLKS